MALQPSQKQCLLMKCQIYWVSKSHHQVLGQTCQMREKSAAITTNPITTNSLFSILLIPNVLSLTHLLIFFSQSYQGYLCILMSVHHLGQVAVKFLSLSDSQQLLSMLFSNGLCSSTLAKVSYVSWTAVLVRQGVS